MPKFSIIVPVYNVIEYLPQCVESIVNQSFRDYELILVDDGSTDGSGDLCDALAEKYGKIHVIHKENGGHSSARKAGLTASGGEYILFVDSDDYLDVNLLQNVDVVLNEHYPDVVAFDFYSVTEEGEILSTYVNKEEEGLYTGEKLSGIRNRCIYDKTIKDLNTGNIAYSLWSKIFRRSCIEAQLHAVPNEIVQGEDLAAVMPVLCACNSLCIYHFAGYYYRQRNTSITHSFNKDDLGRKEPLISHLLSHTPGIDDMNIYLYTYFAMVGYISKAFASVKCFAQFREIMRLPQNKFFMKRVKNIDGKYYDLKENIRLFCVKHELWAVLWVLMRLKN